jgi:hypothetical protein
LDGVFQRVQDAVFKGKSFGFSDIGSLLVHWIRFLLFKEYKVQFSKVGAGFSDIGSVLVHWIGFCFS